MSCQLSILSNISNLNALKSFLLQNESDDNTKNQG